LFYCVFNIFSCMLKKTRCCPHDAKHMAFGCALVICSRLLYCTWQGEKQFTDSPGLSSSQLDLIFTELMVSCLQQLLFYQMSHIIFWSGSCCRSEYHRWITYRTFGCLFSDEGQDLLLFMFGWRMYFMGLPKKNNEFQLSER
jgi:hypothetical protein